MSIAVEFTDLSGALIFTPHRFGDARGFFMETYRRSLLLEHGFDRDFLQDNHAASPARGTFRGLHFQAPPRAQDKLLRVIQGSILDIAVDIREGSRTYGQHIAVELSEENGRQLLIPTGFAHGYLTLTDNVQVLYKVTDYYDPKLERGLRYDDPALAIDWPIELGHLIVNDRDAAWPLLRELQTPFSV